MCKFPEVSLIRSNWVNLWHLRAIGLRFGQLRVRKKTTGKTDYAEKALKYTLDKLAEALYNFGAGRPNFWTW